MQNKAISKHKQALRINTANDFHTHQRVFHLASARVENKKNRLLCELASRQEEYFGLLSNGTYSIYLQRNLIQLEYWTN